MSSIYNLDFNLLKSLRVLLQEKHVSHAAEKLSVTQPSMSHSLRKLREFLSDPLLVRVGNTMELTARADQLNRSLDIIFDELTVVEKGKAFSPDDIDQVFSIDANEYNVRSGISKAVQRMQEIAPKLHFQIAPCTPKSPSDLNSGAVDLIFVSPRRAYPSFRQRVMSVDPIMCLLDKDHPALDNWCSEEIFKHPQTRMSFRTNSGKNTSMIDQFADEQGYAPNVTLSTRSLQMQALFLEGSNRIAFVPEPVAEHAAQHGSLVAKPCPFDLPPVKTVMLWNEINQTDPVHKWVRQMIVEAYS